MPYMGLAEVDAPLGPRVTSSSSSELTFENRNHAAFQFEIWNSVDNVGTSSVVQSLW